jgi:hypothetical protein
MLTSTDEGPWECCMCGGCSGVAHCKACGHDFCRSCRGKWFSRGMEAVKTMLGQTTLLCGGERHD